MLENSGLAQGQGCYSIQHPTSTSRSNEMRLFPTVILALGLVVLPACGDDSTADRSPAAASAEQIVNAANAPGAAQVPEVTFKVTGAVNAEVAGNISVFCSNGDGIGKPSIEVEYVTSRTMLALNLLPDAAGTVALKGRQDSGVQPGQANFVHFRSEDITNFNTGSGELIITSMPTAQGERFIGTLTAELQDKQGNAINIAADYDADAGYQSFDECQGQ
jgi:hypothetical protein